MKILAISFDWKGQLYSDPSFMLRKLERDRIDFSTNEVVLWAFSTKTGTQQIAPHVTVMTRRALVPGFRPPHDYLAQFFVLSDLRRRGFSPDAVIVYDFPFLAAARAVKAAFGCRVVLYLTNLPNDLAKTRSAGSLKALYHRYFERQAPSIIDVVCAINDTTRAYAEEIGIPPAQIHRISPDTVSGEEDLIAHAVPGAVHARFGIASGTRIILSVGRLEAEKGFDRLITAFAALSGMDAALVIVGEGSLREELEARAQELGVTAKVHFAGRVSRAEIWSYFADADAFMLLSRSEALGLVVWEAMRMKVPVIVSRAGGLVESVGTHGEHGFFWEEAEGQAALEDMLMRCFDRTSIADMLERAQAYVRSEAANGTDLAAVLAPLSSMRLLYATSNSYPSSLANRLQTLAMAKEFGSLLGDRFLLGVSAYGSSEPAPFRYRLMPGSQRSFMLAWRYAQLLRRERFTHVFCREYKLFLFLAIYMRVLGVRAHLILELHEIRDTFVFWLAVRSAGMIVTVARGIQERLLEQGIPAVRTLVAPAGVDPERFKDLPSRKDAKRALSLPENLPVVGYIGSFGFVAPWGYNPWKGADVLLKVAQQEQDLSFVFVGGEPDEIKVLRKLYPEANILFLGQRASSEVPLFMRAADVLVLPNKAGDIHSKRYTSPLKLLEYMASGTPVAASDLPSVRELLSEDECVFAAPDDAASLASAIRTILADPEASQMRAARAVERVRQQTWHARAERILAQMDHRA